MKNTLFFIIIVLLLVPIFKDDDLYADDINWMIQLNPYSNYSDIAIDTIGNIYLHNGDTLYSIGSNGVRNWEVASPSFSFETAPTIDNNGIIYLTTDGGCRVLFHLI